MYKYNKKIAILFILYCFMFVFTACSNSGSNHDVVFIIDDSLDNVVIKVKDGEKVEKIDDPKIGDFQFLGWYSSNNFYEEFDFDQEIKKNTNIYAKFSYFELGKENYIAFKEDGLYGFMLPTGEIVIEANYDRVEPFRYGYALVTKDNKVSFIDVLGNEFSEWYQDYSTLTIGYVQFSKDGISKLYVGDNITKMIDEQGEVLFQIDSNEDIRVEHISFYENGLIPITVFDEEDDRNECVFYDSNGEIAIEGNYLACSIFSEGIAAVKIESEIIDSVGTRSHYVFINTVGEIIFETDISELYLMFDGIKPTLFKEGYAIGRVLGQLGDESIQTRYVVIDKQGNIVVDFDNDIPVDVSDGYVLTKNNDNYYAIYDLDGNLIMGYSNQYGGYQYYASTISDGVVVLKNNLDMYGAVDVSTGNIIIDFEYEELMMFIDGYAVAKKDGLYGVIDKDNNIIVDFSYEDMYSVARTLVK
ncbi:MAG: WG repeat-containing protein [Candidatus Izemoplasmatales bacterium]|nr:WG repeat-containing protein [Candidatus Izemoplasmatales bacterium]